MKDISRRDVQKMLTEVFTIVLFSVAAAIIVYSVFVRDRPHKVLLDMSPRKANEARWLCYMDGKETPFEDCVTQIKKNWAAAHPEQQTP